VEGARIFPNKMFDYSGLSSDDCLADLIRADLNDTGLM